MGDFRYGPPPRGFMGGRGGPPPIQFRGTMLPPHMQQRMPVNVPVAAMQVAPLPVGWSEHVTPQGVRYYYNTATGVSTYERPTVATTAAVGGVSTPAAVVNAEPTPSPVTMTWIEYKDDASGLNYYYNTITKATTWDQPEEFRMQQARAEVEKIKSSTEANGVIVAEEQRKRDTKQRQADDEAIKKFETMAKDERVVEFKTFLEEKQVSPQLKWQELLRFLAKEKLDTDPRWKFALATVGEKKQAFSEYCTQVVNKQTIEKRRQAKKIREEFLELLVAIEDKAMHNRVTWDDVNQGAEFYGLRKDPRWAALDDGKDKKDLFESFMQDLLRKKDQLKAKQVDGFKDAFLAKLREKATQDLHERVFFVGKRRLDSELKKKVWDLVHELNAPKAVAKQDVYEWTEKFLEVLEAEDAEAWKAEKERKKVLDLEFLKNVQNLVEEWLKSERIDMNTAWKDVSEAMIKEIAPPELPSERRQRRGFEKKMKRERGFVKPVAAVVSKYLTHVGVTVTATTTFEEFSMALRSGILHAIELTKPEEGEEEASQSKETTEGDDKALETELCQLVQSSTTEDPSTIAWPLRVKHAFQLLKFDADNKSARPHKTSSHGRGRSRSSSPPPSSSRKRRRSSVESPSNRSRSPSHHRSRSRSRSHSSRRRRHRSRSESRDPRAALAVPSYRDLPPSPTTASSTTSTFVSPRGLRATGSTPAVVDEAARAEEIIRQARLKLQAKKQRDDDGSEPEEGEEMEDGEIDEDE